MSDLKLRLANSVKDAMRAKASERLSTLRFLQAAIKQREVDERKELSDAVPTPQVPEPHVPALHPVKGI